MNSDWKVVELNSLIKKTIGGGTPSKKVDEFWNGSIPWASVKDFNESLILSNIKDSITLKGLNSSASNLIQPDTPILCMRMAVGRIAKSEVAVAINQDLRALIPFEDVDTLYFLYLLQLNKEKIEAKGIGSTVKGISINDLLSIKVIHSKNKKRQTKIAKILTTIDNVIEKTEEAIAKYEAIKQGMMQDLLTRGIGEDGQLRPIYEEAPELYKESELGWIPKKWEVKKLEKLSEIKGGKRLPAGEEFADGITPYPYIRVTDMRDGSVRTENLVYVKPEIQKFIKKYTISKEDLYITIAGTLGLVGEIPVSLDNAQLTENAAKIVIRDFNSLSKTFLKYFFQSTHYPKQLYKEIGIGGGVPKLALHRILNFRIVKPNLEEQVEIKERVKRIYILINREKQKLNKQTQLKQGLMQDLLTGKVPVHP